MLGSFLAFWFNDAFGLDPIVTGLVLSPVLSSPRILLVDEPSVGLAPIMVSRVIEVIRERKKRLGLTVLMTEQNFNQAIKIADRGYVIVHGEIAFEGKTTQELRNNELVKRLYFGKRRAAMVC